MTPARRRSTPGGAALAERVRAAIAASFGLDEDELPHPASRETIAEWTSRTHLSLVLNLEARFEVTFSLEQLVAMSSEQSIVAVLRELTAGDGA